MVEACLRVGEERELGKESCEGSNGRDLEGHRCILLYFFVYLLVRGGVECSMLLHGVEALLVVCEQVGR